MNFQTIKKWIYNNYTGEQIENIVILNKGNFDVIYIIDNNNYKNDEFEKLLSRTIDVVTVISAIDYVENNFNVSFIYNYNKYWELENLKILDL